MPPNNRGLIFKGNFRFFLIKGSAKELFFSFDNFKNMISVCKNLQRGCPRLWQSAFVTALIV